MEKNFLKERENFLREILSDLQKKLESWSATKFEPGDELDITSQEKEHSNVLKFRNRTAKYMKKVEHSLAKVKNGEYGFCEDCGSKIEQNRLKARPTATLCINCKEEQEREQGQVAKILPFKKKSPPVWEKVSGDALDL